MTDRSRDPEIQELLDDLFHKADQKLWMETPNPLLQLRAPKDCSDEEVLRVLSGIADGAFV